MLAHHTWMLLVASSMLFLIACSDAEPMESPTYSPDVDQDGYTVAEGDCDDTKGWVYPSAREYCDELDNDCDGEVDEEVKDLPTWCFDADGDGSGDISTAILACEGPSGYAQSCSDCDDTSATICPQCPDLCADGIDNNCNDAIDEDTPLFYRDSDGDGYGDLLNSVPACSVPSGYAAVSTDCNDLDNTIHPGALDICSDTIDNNCDGRAADCGLSPSMTTLDADGSFEGADGGDYAGDEIAANGDINGDGFTDLLIMSIYVDFDGASNLYEYGDGLIHLFYGPLSGNFVPEQADARFIGESDCQLRGMSSGGDINGDGIDDIVIAAPCAFSQNEDCGKGAVLVYYGPIHGDVRAADADSIILGERRSGFGFSASIGDANADGYGDVLVGAAIADPIQYREGGAYLFHGPFDAEVNLDQATAYVVGEHEGAMAGERVSLQGDLNGDGLDDLVIGAPEDSSITCGNGAAYVLYSPVEGTVSLSDADARLFSSVWSDQAGTSTSTGNDVNGDGFDDLLIGAFGQVSDYFCGTNDPAVLATGNAYLVLGPVYGTWELADIAHQFSGEYFNDGAGHSVSLEGDVDGDGNEDLVVGASSVESGDITIGTVYVQYGPFSADESLGDSEVRITGVEDATAFGQRVELADLNADGYSDVIISAPQKGDQGGEPGGDYGGFIYLFLGGPRLASP